MDPHSATQTTPQTIAQAVQAATQQAQQIASHSSPQAQTTQSSTIDNLTCQWQGCGERCDTAEALYDHVCERHVGRKSTNNLNLTCQWGACRTTTVKRDHITSHIRVHVPLKPHKCDFCQKAFKRPQDLKKHVKTHADDSVLMDSPQHGQNGRVNGGGLQHQTNGKPTSGYYPASHDVSLNPYPSYQPAMTAGLGHGATYAHAGANGQYAGYGNVSYPNSAAMADIQSLDTRRRAIEALNDFLGDIKRRAIDPGNYYDVGQRLQTNALPLPVGTGYNTGYSSNNYNANYNTASLLESFNNGGSLHQNLGPQTQSLSAPGYSLPLPNARTKSDLHDIDRFLEQLQSTVYENTTAASAAGVHQIDQGHMPFLGNAGSYRPSHSPPHAFSDGLTSGGSVATASSIDTPIQTPSSISSYSASLSPVSSHSRTSFGSGSVGGSGNMYPSLPAVTGMSDLGSNYPNTASAPASVLAHDFNNPYGRRRSNSRLQKVVPADAQDRDTEMLDADDSGSKTPRADDAGSIKKEDNSIDPALRDEDEKASTPVASESDQDKRQEQWVENIRVIEALRKWIGERLKQGEFEEEGAASSEAREPSEEDLKTVETAKMVAEKLAGAEIAAKDVEALVEYPKLPTSS